MPPKKKKEDTNGGAGGGNGGDEKKNVRRRLLPNQVEELEAHFSVEMYPSTKTKETLAVKLDLRVETVDKWFVNRRVRLREKEREAALKGEEYSGKDAEVIKMKHDTNENESVDIEEKGEGQPTEGMQLSTSMSSVPQAYTTVSPSIFFSKLTSLPPHPSPSNVHTYSYTLTFARIYSVCKAATNEKNCEEEGRESGSG